MAWRIDDAVTRGEIDNRTEGRTIGRVWLAGREEPLVLRLEGDCWRDLAGSLLTFENPSPKPETDTQALAPMQEGVIGDMTASRKCRVPTVADEELHRLYQADEDVPCEWRNVLYLEWFSETNGRVVIESHRFRLRITPHEWMMDEDEEEAQKLANLHAMRDFMAQVIRRREIPEGEYEPEVELDEFAWEERLKESDRLTDAYQEVLEKYMDDADSERKEAFVMGWDGLLDALAEREEENAESGDEGFPPGSMFEDDDDEDALFEDGDSLEDDDEEDHPLQIKARELALRAMDVVQRDAGPGTPAYRVVSLLLQVSGKLAAALNGRGSGYEPETGYVLALLKRCLNWLNEAVGACQELMAAEEDPDQLAALAHIRSSAFEIRDGVTELRRELK